MAASNYFISCIYGEHFLSNWVQAIDTYGGIVVFFLMIAYNTRLCRLEYEAGRADHLGISMRFLSDCLVFVKRALRAALQSLIGRK